MGWRLGREVGLDGRWSAGARRRFRARGRLGGRPKLLSPEKRRLAVQLYRAKEHSIVEICRLMGISKPTLYSYLAEAGG